MIDDSNTVKYNTMKYDTMKVIQYNINYIHRYEMRYDECALTYNTKLKLLTGTI